MSITQIKRDLSGIRRALKPGRPFENIIIYDPVKGIPELNSDETLIFLPEDGRDLARIYLPDNGRDNN
jgi:hypothetical protein